MAHIKNCFLHHSAQARLSERREEKIKEMKSKYERQLTDMKRELKQLQLAKKEHSKALKKNVNCPLQALFTSFSVIQFVCSCS